jgi:hypothetical protein
VGWRHKTSIFQGELGARASPAPPFTTVALAVTPSRLPKPPAAYSPHGKLRKPQAAS